MRALLFLATLSFAAACGPKSAAPEEAVEIEGPAEGAAEASAEGDAAEGDAAEGVAAVGPWLPMTTAELEECAAVIDAAFEGVTPTMNPGAGGEVQEAQEAQMDAVRKDAEADEALMSCCERTAGHFSVVANPTLANNWKAKDTCCDLLAEGAPPVCER